MIRSWQGLSLVFTAAGLLLGTGWIFGGPLRRPMLVFPPLMLAGVVISLASGIRQSRFDQPFRRVLSGAMISGLFMLAVGVPIGAKRLWTERQAAQLPVLADASTYFSHHAVVGGDGYPDYGVFYFTDLSLADAANALDEEFRRDGWKVGVDKRLSKIGVLRFARCYRGDSELVYELSQWPPGSKTTVHIKQQDWWVRSLW